MFSKFRTVQPNFHSKLFSEFLLSLKQSSKSSCHRITFIIRLIGLLADKAMLFGGNFFF